MLVFSKKLVMDGIYDVFILSVCSITQVRMVNLSYHLFLVGLVLSITNNQNIKKVSIQILCFDDCSAPLLPWKRKPERSTHIYD